MMLGLMVALKTFGKKIGTIEELDVAMEKLPDVLREYGLAE